MALPLDTVVQQLRESGVVAPEQLAKFLPPNAAPKDGDALCLELVKQNLLTKFQAQQVAAGKTRTLLLDVYTIVDKIGAGGMGQVFKARHRRMERTVALKVMSPAAMKDEAAVKRFQREVRAAARLEHPNIVTAYDSGEAGNVKYLVMQFVDGGDLSDLVKKNGPLPIEKAVNFVLQAARGLAFAHAEGVIHRDIKPANLLLDKKGVVKILDMGLARIESSDDGLTATEQVMGTVDYMSPEQAANTKGVDGRADIYSLGCTLWFLLTGKKAYEADSMIARLMAHKDAPLPSLVKTRDDAPWPLEQAFHRMIAKRAEDRFQSMDEVIAALEPFAAGGISPTGMGSSLGQGSQNAELSAFLKGVGPATKPQAKPSPSKTNVEFEATAQFVSPDVATDPKSEIVASGKLAAGLAPRAAAKPQAKGAGAKTPPNKNLILAGAGGAALLVLLGVWFIFRDKDGNETARVQLPDGGSVTVQPSGTTQFALPPTAPPPTAPPSSNVSFFNTNPPAAAPPPGDYALKLDHADAPLNLDLTQPFTLEAYITPSGDSERTQMAFDCPKVVNLYGGRKWGFAVGDQGKNWNMALSSISPVAGKRTHVAGVFTPQRIQLFIDGVLEKTTELNGSNLPPSAPLGIGYQFSDRIDEIRVSKTARYTANFKPSARHAPDADTLLLYHCDEGHGNLLTDASGNRRDALVHGALWTKADGSPIPLPPIAAAPTAPPPAGDYVLELKGFDQSSGAAWVDVPSLQISEVGPLTLEARVWALTHNEGYVLGTNDLRLRISAGNWTARSDNDNPATQLKLSPIEYKRWYHLALVRTAKDIRMYVDGKQTASAPVLDRSGPQPPPRSLPLKIGGNNIHVRIDEIRVSKTARYDAEFSPSQTPFAPDADTLALYHCDDGAGDVLRDASSNKHDGKITKPSWLKPDGSPIPAFSSPASNPSPAAAPVAGGWTIVATETRDGPARLPTTGAAPTISSDGLTFVGSTSGTERDVTMATRNRLGDPWPTPVNLGPVVNVQGGLQDAEDGYATISQDRKSLVFFSKREKSDAIWSTVRADAAQPFPAPVRLSDEINSPNRRSWYPGLSADGQWLTFLQAKGSREYTGRIARRKGAGPEFAAPQPLGPAIDALGDPRFSTVTDDGLTLVIVVAQTPAPEAPKALWTATRRATDAPFENPVELGPEFRESNVLSASISGDGRTLWVIRNGDLIQATRSPAASGNGVNPASVIYLDDLPETAFECKGELRKHGRNRDGNGDLNWLGQTPSHSLFTHPVGVHQPAWVTYALDGRYAEFRTTVGTCVVPDSPMIFRILGDDKPLWESKPQVAAQVAVNAVVDVRGVKVLKLEASTVGSVSGAHAVWIDPRLTPAALPAAPNPAGVVYLDDLPELEFQVWGDRGFGKHGKFHQGKDEQTIQWRGKPVTHALWMHPTWPKGGGAFVRYQLDGKYLTFAAEAGIPVTTSKDPQSPVHFRVLGDGRELWKSLPLQARGESAEVSVDVRGVKELRLETSCEENNGNCHATWFMPRLTPISNAPAPTSDPPAAAVVYLDDLPEVRWAGRGDLGKHGRKAKIDGGGLIDWFLYYPKHSLFGTPGDTSHSAVIEYDLAGRYARFDATVGLLSEPGSPHTFRVWGDDKQLWESPPLSDPNTRNTLVSVDVAGVKRLKLELVTGGKPGPGFPVWIDPRLTPVASVATPVAPPAAPPTAVFPFDAATALKHQEAWAKHLGVPVEFTNTVGMKFRLIPPGEFQMGLGPEFTDEELTPLTGPPGKHLINARPAHLVRITKPFYLEVEEITSGHYRNVVGQLRPEMQQDPNNSLVDFVAFADAIVFCNKLSEREGKRPAYRIDGTQITPIDDADGYCLPTEAQWEFACRAGTNTLWYFGNDRGADNEEFKQLYAAPNPFGLTGLYSGANEWCWDSTPRGGSPYSGSLLDRRDDPQEEVGPHRIKRGGSGHDGGGTDRRIINSFARSSAEGGPYDPAAAKWTGFGRVVLPITAARASIPAEPRTSVGEPAALTEMDLLPLVDLPQDVLSGQWSRQGSELHSNAVSGTNQKVRLPVDPGEAYSLRIAFAVNRGYPKITLPLESKALLVAFSADTVELQLAGPKGGAANPSFKGAVRGFGDGARHEIKIDVSRPSADEVRIAVAVAGKPALDWTGTREQLRAVVGPDLPEPVLMFESFQTEATAVQLLEAKLTTTAGAMKPLRTASTVTMPAVTTIAAPRWPLAPSKPEDIQWLLARNCVVTLRGPSAFGGDPLETSLKVGDAIPSGSQTVVGIDWETRNENFATDDDLARIATFVDLEQLNFKDTAMSRQITSAGMLKLAALVNLRRLTINQCKDKALGAEGILQAMPHLEFLHLPFGTNVSSVWAAAAAARPSITEIRAFRCEYTDANLVHFEKMPQLTLLDLSDNATLTEAAVEKLAAAKPHCRIIASFNSERRIFEPRTPSAPAPK